MAEVKGLQLKATLMFLRERYGDKAVDDAIAALNPEDRSLLPRLLLDSNWYDYDVWRAVRRVSRAVATGAGPEVSIDMGKFLARYVFGGVYRSLLLKDPVKQVQEFPRNHEFFYRSSQELETEVLSDSSCFVRYHYQNGLKPARSTCLVMMGFWMQTIELSGGSNVKAKHTKCVAAGQDCCEFHLEWQASLAQAEGTGQRTG